MKKFLFFFSIIFLILATTITKNSTKKLDKKIFQTKEQIRFLEDKYQLELLDYNYNTSPKKLMEYQEFYFENELIQINIEDLNWIKINDNQIENGKILKNNE